MPRFFIDSVPHEYITVTGSDARHMGYSLRMKTGDAVTFCHMGTDYFCTITNMDEDSVVCRIDSSEPSVCEPSVFLTIYQAFPKQDKFETIIQKTTELGASRIVPFISRRCVARPDKKDFTKKLERFRRISEEAAKQAGRGIIPEVTPVMTFDDALQDMKQNELMLFCYENDGKRLSEFSLTDYKTIGVMIGSEGGFERSESDKAEEAGAHKIWLGERILRCETCPVAVSAIIMNLTGNM
jgi:16S rRNA (uracil1498-N3)-methyltransferase